MVGIRISSHRGFCNVDCTLHILGDDMSLNNGIGGTVLCSINLKVDVSNILPKPNLLSAKACSYYYLSLEDGSSLLLYP